MVLSFRCHYFGSEYTVAGDLWGGIEGSNSKKRQCLAVSKQLAIYTENEEKMNSGAPRQIQPKIDLNMDHPYENPA